MTLVPHNSRRERFVNFILRGPINLYKKINEKNYHIWISRHDVLSEPERLLIFKRIESLERKPLLSVLMPVYNPPIHYLDEAIKSVKGQLYPHWELCIADDASPNQLVKALIEKHAKEDPRIRYVFRNANGHISASSNSALEIATGEFAVLLDHDDVLHPLALYYVGEEINKYPEAEIIYSDEDRLNERGERIIPYFKSDFDYDLLLCQNMVSHLGVYRTNTLREVGGFRIGFEGSQDHDLVLRMVEKIEPRQIRHIPRILYHWRVSNKSAASGADAKPYAYDAGLHAIKDHLKRKKVDAIVEPTQGLYAYRVKYATPQPQPSVDIIIRTMGLTKKLEQCVNSILSNTKYQNYNISIYLNRVPESAHQMSDKHWFRDNRVSVTQNKMGTNQSKLINQIVMNSNAEYICLLVDNADGFSTYWLELLVGQAAQPGVGAVGPLLLRPNNRIFSSGFILRTDEIATHLFAGLPKHPSYFGWATIQKGFSAISDSCLLVSKSHFFDIGGYTGILSNRYFANVDFCLKLREKGLRNVVTPIAELYIHQNTAYNQAFWRKMNVLSSGWVKDLEYIKDRWRVWLEHDPAFNPNLDLKKGGISLISSRPSINNWK